MMVLQQVQYAQLASFYLSEFDPVFAIFLDALVAE